MRWIVGFVGAGALFALQGCADDDKACVPGSTQVCVCPGGGSGAQTCADEGNKWGPCQGCKADADAGPDHKAADGPTLDKKVPTPDKDKSDAPAGDVWTSKDAKADISICGGCKIDGKCYAKGAKGPSGCFICDPSKSATKWTLVAGLCLIDDKCYKAGEKPPGGCASCVPAKAKYAWTVTPGHCKIDGACLAAGAKHPQGCASCDPAKSTTAWTASYGCVIDQQCRGKGAKDPTGCGVCDPAKDATDWTVAGNSCLVGGKCFPGGASEPGGCGVCKPSAAKTSWTKPAGCGATYAWSRSYGDTSTEYGRAVGADASGNVFFAGSYFGSSYKSGYNGISFGGQTHKGVGNYGDDAFIASLTPGGQYRWSKTFGHTSGDRVHDLALDKAGNLYVIGRFHLKINFGGAEHKSKGSGDVFIASFTSSGTYRWSRTFGDKSNDYGNGVATDGAGNVYLTGHFSGSSGISFDGTTQHKSKGSYDLFVASYDSAGKHRWSRTMGGTSSDFGQGIAVDASGNSYLTGHFSKSVNLGGKSITSKGSGDIYVASYDSAGKHRWSKGFGDQGNDQGHGVAVDPGGNVYITGIYVGGSAYKGIGFGGATLKSNGQSDLYVASFTSGGAHRWSKNFGSSSHDYGHAIASDHKGNVYLTGSAAAGIDFGGGTLKTNGKFDLFVASLTSAGSHRWSRSHGDIGDDRGRKIATDPMGGVLVTGEFYSSASSPYNGISLGGALHKSKGGDDVFLLKLKP